MDTRPLTPRLLAQLLLQYTYDEIAQMYDTCRSVIQTQRDSYDLLKLSRKARYKLLTRKDITMWQYDTSVEVPWILRKRVTPITWARYGNKTFFMSLVRATIQFMIQRMIPTFIDVHHICTNEACNNPNHCILVVEQAHIALHNGKIDEIPDSLRIDMKDLNSGDDNQRCCHGRNPDYGFTYIPDQVWDKFLINSMCVRRILKDLVDHE